MDSVVEDIKSRLNIVDLIGEYVRLQKSGTNWKGLCPFHREKTPSFMASEEKQIWHCFGCGKGGDAIGFLMEIEGIEFKEALRILAEKTGVELPKYNRQEEKGGISKKKILEILELAAKFYEKQLWDGAGKNKILPYLYNRGLKEESIKDFRLGYAPDGWDNLLKFLAGRGYTTEEIARTGLLVSKNESGKGNYYDRFRDRITFPIADVMGQVVGFSARVAPGGDETQAKYVNTPETEVYHKSKVLYGLNRAKQNIKNENAAVVVEGNMDVIAAHQAGIKNTVAVSGTALTPEQVDIIKRYSNKLKMLFDMDRAGQQATKRSAEICFQKEMSISVVTLPEGKDAAELVNKNPQEFTKAVKKSEPAMEYFFNSYFQKFDKDKIEDKKVIASELLNIIKNFGNAIEKSHWIRKLSQKLEVEENILMDIFRKAQSRLRGDYKKEESPKSVSKPRSEAIREKIVGLMLADPALWEKISKDEEKKEWFSEDSRFLPVFGKGPQAEYKFENLISILQSKDEKDFFQKLYFETRYTQSENGIVENEIEDIKDQLDYYFSELKKESGKARLKVLLADIKRAEGEGDKEGKILLINEFNKLSQEVK